MSPRDRDLRRRSDDRGASAVEYALLLSGLSVVVLLAAMGVGINAHDLFGSSLDRLSCITTSSC